METWKSDVTVMVRESYLVSDYAIDEFEDGGNAVIGIDLQCRDMHHISADLKHLLSNIRKKIPRQTRLQVTVVFHL